MADYRQIQAALNKAGANPPLAVDGIFGAKSLAAVTAFQKSRGLAADGVVGPKTLAALGLSDSAPTPASGGTSLMGSTGGPANKSYQEAYQIAKRALPNEPEAQIQYALTVAAGEGGFGKGWGSPSASTIAKSQQFGLTGYEGAGSNNWGATQGSGDAGSFPHVDSHADGSLYVGNYRKWSTPEKGFIDVYNILFKGGKRGATGAAALKSAIAKGNLREAVFAQHANGYFELNPEQYLKAVIRNYGTFVNSTGWKQLLGPDGVKTGLGALGVAILGGLGYAGYRYLTKS